jgi:hypothetical protein
VCVCMCNFIAFIHGVFFLYELSAFFFFHITYALLYQIILPVVT